MNRTTKCRQALTVLLAAAGLAACGSGGGASISADTARLSVERSAQVELAPFSLPAEAREQGLTSAYTNTPTAAGDGQAVAVFLTEDAGVVDAVRDQVRQAVPEPSELIVNDNVMVVYAATGTDRLAQVEKAVAGL